MYIKLRHKSTEQVATIETEHNKPDEVVKCVKINATNEEVLKSELEDAYGFYGHIIDLNHTTNLDLAAAVYQLPSYAVIQIEPLPMPEPLPEGVQT